MLKRHDFVICTKCSKLVYVEIESKLVSDKISHNVHRIVCPHCRKAMDFKVSIKVLDEKEKVGV